MSGSEEQQDTSEGTNSRDIPKPPSQDQRSQPTLFAASVPGFCVNSNGGVYKQGLAFDVTKKAEVAHLYERLKPISLRKLAAAANVGTSFAHKVIKEVEAGGIQDPKKRIKNIVRGQGTKILTEKDQEILLKLIQEDPERTHGSLADELYQRTGTVISKSVLCRVRQEWKKNDKVSLQKRKRKRSTPNKLVTRPVWLATKECFCNNQDQDEVELTPNSEVLTTKPTPKSGDDGAEVLETVLDHCSEEQSLDGLIEGHERVHEQSEKSDRHRTNTHGGIAKRSRGRPRKKRPPCFYWNANDPFEATDHYIKFIIRGKPLPLKPLNEKRLRGDPSKFAKKDYCACLEEMRNYLSGHVPYFEQKVLLKVSLKFGFPTSQVGSENFSLHPDLNHLVNFTLDCLTGLLFESGSQVVHLDNFKQFNDDFGGEGFTDVHVEILQ